MGTPCSRMCVVGPRQIDPATAAQNAFTFKVAAHQDAEGLGASIENPAGTLLIEQKGFSRVCGTMERPKPGWNFYRSHGCQFALECPAPYADIPFEPIQKSALWIANFDLAIMELHCRSPMALVHSAHVHKHARGTAS